MSFEFPLAYRRTPFGLLSDPQIPATVRGPAGDLDYRFLVDTGAEFAVAPRRLADEAGLIWHELPTVRMVGVEQRGVDARLGGLPLRIVSVELTVRCLFVDNPRTPFILGRADFLDRFILTLDQPGRRIILHEVPESG